MSKIDNDDMRQSELDEDHGPGESGSSHERQLWIIDQYAVPPTMSGFTRQFEHAALLKAMGWQSRIVASPFNHKTHVMDRPVSLKNRRLDQDEGGVPVTWVHSIPYQGNNWRRYLNMLSFLVTSQISSNGVAKPDVVFASSPHLFTGLAGWITAKRFRTPFIFEVRDLWPESLVQLGLTNPAIIKPLAWMEKFLYHRADAIVALTEGIGADIQSRIEDPEKVHVLPNAVQKPTAIDTQRKVAIRDQMGWRSDEVVAIYAGAHGDANDLGQVVAAARSLTDKPNIRFVLLGDGPTKAGLKMQSSDLENIDYLDAVPKSEIGEILQSADIGLLTLKPISLFEGARPNKLFDYMGAGLPIVSTVRGETERVLTESGGGIAVSPDDLARAVSQIAENVDQRETMSRLGFHHASTVQTREDVVREFAKLLDELVTV